jgi:hypothetical protein
MRQVFNLWRYLFLQRPWKIVPRPKVNEEIVGVWKEGARNIWA